MGDPETNGGGRGGLEVLFQNVPACDKCLTTTELSIPIKEDSVTWPELPIPTGKPNSRSPIGLPDGEREVKGDKQSLKCCFGGSLHASGQARTTQHHSCPQTMTRRFWGQRAGLGRESHGQKGGRREMPHLKCVRSLLLQHCF